MDGRFMEVGRYERLTDGPPVNVSRPRRQNPPSFESSDFTHEKREP